MKKVNKSALLLFVAAGALAGCGGGGSGSGGSFALPQSVDASTASPAASTTASAVEPAADKEARSASCSTRAGPNRQRGPGIEPGRADGGAVRRECRLDQQDAFWRRGLQQRDLRRPDAVCGEGVLHASPGTCTRTGTRTCMITARQGRRLVHRTSPDSGEVRCGHAVDHEVSHRNGSLYKHILRQRSGVHDAEVMRLGRAGCGAFSGSEPRSASQPSPSPSPCTCTCTCACTCTCTCTCPRACSWCTSGW